MNFDSDAYVTPFVKMFSKCPIILDTVSDTIVQRLYQMFLNADTYIGNDNIRIKVKDEEDATENENDSGVPNIDFFPPKIQQFIKHTKFYKQVTCTCTSDLPKLQNITIQFNVYKSVDFAELMKQQHEKIRNMFLWLYCCRLASTCQTVAHSLTVTIYQTPFLKELPLQKDEVLQAEHVNTAYTYPCPTTGGKIVIYRKEEWFKVFLHESMHTFGFDLNSDRASMDEIRTVLKENFPGMQHKSDMLISETIAEVWARILNATLHSFFCSKSKTKTQKRFERFSSFLNFTLQLERLFSIYQCQKVLKHMGLTYDTLQNETMVIRNYKEQTNVFAYYVLTSVLLNNYPSFLAGCQNWNKHLFDFNFNFNFNFNSANRSTFIQFLDFEIKNSLPDIQSHFENTSTPACLIKTTRMSLI